MQPTRVKLSPGLLSITLWKMELEEPAQENAAILAITVAVSEKGLYL